MKASRARLRRGVRGVKEMGTERVRFPLSGAGCLACGTRVTEPPASTVRAVAMSCRADVVPGQ